MARKDDRTVSVGLTGASGAQYGLRLIECLVKADYTVYVMFTKAAQIVVGSETDCRLPGRTAEQTRYLSTLFGARDGQLRVFGDELSTGKAPGLMGVVSLCHALARRHAAGLPAALAAPPATA